MPDMVWAENERLPDRKIQLTTAQFRVYARNGWKLTDPPEPSEDDKAFEAEIEAAAKKAAVAKADQKPAPKKSTSTRTQKTPSKSSSADK